MPGVYKKKQCPSCKKEHRQRNQFCSKSCSNTARTGNVSAETREKIAAGNRAYRNTPEGIATTKIIARVTEKRHAGIISLPEDEWFVEVPILDDEDDGFNL